MNSDNGKLWRISKYTERTEMCFSGSLVLASPLLDTRHRTLASCVTCFFLHLWDNWRRQTPFDLLLPPCLCLEVQRFCEVVPSQMCPNMTLSLSPDLFGHVHSYAGTREALGCSLDTPDLAFCGTHLEACL